MNRSLYSLLLLAVLGVSSGATCLPNRQPADPFAPVVFQAPPTLSEILFAVNANTDRVQQLHTDSARVSTPGLPGLRTSLSLERPNRLRLRAKLIGPELDLGSNDQIFWFWAKSAPQPAVFFASHRDFSASPTRQLFPVDPHWLVDAIGLVRLEPGGNHEGPFPRADGHVEVRTRLPSSQGELTRILVIDQRYGWILEQHLLDTTGQLVAASRTTAHRYYAAANASLPHVIEIDMPAAQLQLQIDVGEFEINQLYEDPRQLWTMPDFEGYTRVNLAAPRMTSGTAAPAMEAVGPNGSSLPPPQIGRPRRHSRTARVPNYRGHSPHR